jgi:hypothetical protein
MHQIAAALPDGRFLEPTGTGHFPEVEGTRRIPGCGHRVPGRQRCL